MYRFRTISQIESFGSSSKHAEIGPESFGIVVRRRVGTAPDIFSLLCPALGPNPVRNRTFPDGSLKVVWDLLAEPSVQVGFPHSHRPALVTGGLLGFLCADALGAAIVVVIHPQVQSVNNKHVRKGSGDRDCAIKVRNMVGAVGPMHVSHFHCAISAPRPSPDTVVAQF